MAKILYMDDGYLTEFDATVTRVEGDGKAVALDQTAFYPTGGGQPNDEGKLVRVSDGKEFLVTTVRKAEGEILHDVCEPGLVVGDKVRGEIDWKRRFKLMRMHTAAHVLAATVGKLAGALVTGKQLELQQSRIDFSVEQFDREKIQQYTDEANKAIATNAPVKTYFLPREEAMKIPGIVKLAERMPPNIPELRIVEIVGVDIQACGGTHVKAVGEIGKINVLKAENKGKTNRRMYYKVE